MDVIIVKEERCKQCGLCIEHCPKGAISFADHFNSAGMTPVQVDDEKCIKCGMCYTMCPDGVYEISNNGQGGK
ncbi:4Fe-4S binding protein [Pseudodesulfovibrio tunisiensis]|uniref:4Fe-4S binding protein n=1 Tax=Pseudodesulfovibrio tunisiensis TaxID=463192 RepID=UPI001FB52FE8|nr:4Fe-4S binding protein [Pseudodesulfovibrio tunisiensis]